MPSDNPILEQLGSIPDNKFTVYLPVVTLEKKGKLITGSGHLFKEEGGFTLNVINDRPPSKEEETFNFLKSAERDVQHGEILSAEEFCFRMDGTDIYGNSYSCKCVDVGADYARSYYSCAFKADIFINAGNDIEPQKGYVSIALRNYYEFAPTDQFFQRTYNALREGYWGGIWRVSVDELVVTLYKNPNQLSLAIEGEITCLDQNLIRTVIDSLDFVMGEEHRYYYLVFFGTNDAFSVRISTNSKATFKSTLTPPYRKNGAQGDEAKENAKLFTQFYRYIKVNPKTILVKLNKRLYDSGTGYYYKYGLVIGISIEKVLKTYYPNLLQSSQSYDPSDIGKLESIIDELKNETLKKRVKGFIDALLKPFDYKPKLMLIQLEDRGVVGIGSVQSWEKLRNAYVHGHDYNDDMRKAVKLVRSNLTIYYELIFNIIKYDGKYESWSEGGTKLKNYE